MNFVNITANNFLTFEQLEFDFLTGKSVLIKGENNTDPGQRSNGSGKSAFSAIIEYCLLHTTSRKTLDKDLVTWGQREAYLSLTINCAERKEKLLIERKIDIKNGGSSQLSINGDIKYSFEDRMVSEIDKFIEQWVGISASDIQNYFLISKFKYSSFYSSSNTQLNQLIGRFSNASIIDGIDKDVEAEADKLEKRRQVMNDGRNKLLGSIEAYNTQLENAKLVTKEDLYNAEVRNLESLIEDKRSIINNNLQSSQKKLDEVNAINKQIEEHNGFLLETKQTLQSYKVKDFDSVISKVDDNIAAARRSVSDKQLTLDRNNSQKQELLLMLQQAELNIKGSVKCPKCSHEFVVGKDINIDSERWVAEETKLLIKEFDEVLSSIKEEIGAIYTKLDGLNGERRSLEIQDRELRETKRRIENKIHEFESAIRNAESRAHILMLDIESLNKHNNKLESDIDTIEASIKSLDVNSFDNKESILSIEMLIAKCNDDIEEINKNEADLQAEISKHRQWIQIFREFRQHLSIKVLKILQGHTNKFLEDLKTDLRVKIEGYKVKADGEKSDKITVTIIRDGEIRDFNSFSGGERARLEAAVILAVQKAINSTHKLGGLDFLLIDEVLESADSEGVTQIMKAFNELPKTILLTTHVPVESFEFPTILVRKENKRSKIYYNE